MAYNNLSRNVYVSTISKRGLGYMYGSWGKRVPSLRSGMLTLPPLIQPSARSAPHSSARASSQRAFAGPTSTSAPSCSLPSTPPCSSSRFVLRAANFCAMRTLRGLSCGPPRRAPMLRPWRRRRPHRRLPRRASPLSCRRRRPSGPGVSVALVKGVRVVS